MGHPPSFRYSHRYSHGPNHSGFILTCGRIQRIYEVNSNLSERQHSNRRSKQRVPHISILRCGPSERSAGSTHTFYFEQHSLKQACYNAVFANTGFSARRSFFGSRQLTRGRNRPVSTRSLYRTAMSISESRSESERKWGRKPQIDQLRMLRVVVMLLRLHARIR